MMQETLATTGVLARSLGPRAFLFGVVGFLAALLIVGVPTAIVETPFFSRMVPVRTQDYVLWVVTAALLGLIAATFAAPAGGGEGKVASGGLLGMLAVGCPVCNKAVVLFLGSSGALNLFAPAQLLLGLASVALLVFTLYVRVNYLAVGCAIDLQDVASGQRNSRPNNQPST